VSQDGLWMVHASDETGRLEVYVQSFLSGGSKSQISANSGWDPKWSAKGTELFFLLLNGS
jgi:Tol biopolymer transport system component